jgi:hypothetical protein
VAYSESQPDIGTPDVDPNQKEPKKKRVVVLGTGWAGTSLLKDLDASLYDVQVVSPRNYFAFTPLLPSVTVGTVEARSIVEPIRNMVKKVSETKQELQEFFWYIYPIASYNMYVHTYRYICACMCVCELCDERWICNSIYLEIAIITLPLEAKDK